jgi:hypothetical protein
MVVSLINRRAGMLEYKFKSMMNDNGVFTIVKFYRSPTLGECHVGYMKIAADSEESAIEIASQAM